MNGGRVFWGLLLILVGIIFTLSNFGILSHNFIFSLFKFWPLLVIIWGLSIITGKTKGSFWLVIILIMVLLVGGGMSWTSYQYKNEKAVSVKGEESLPIEAGIEKGSFKIDYGAGNLGIGKNPGKEINFIYKDSFAAPKLDYKIKNNQAEYKIKHSTGRTSTPIPNKPQREWKVNLPQNLLWDLELNLGAAKAELDFREIDLKSLDLDMGAGDITIWLGERGLETDIDIDAGASNIKIIVPQNMELKIKVDGGLNSTNLGDLGLTKKDGYYIIEDITSSSKLILKFEGGVSRFELVRCGR